MKSENQQKAVGSKILKLSIILLHSVFSKFVSCYIILDDTNQNVHLVDDEPKVEDTVKSFQVKQKDVC